MKILITGAAGFVGSNLAVHLKRTLSGAEIFGIDNLVRRGSELNLATLKDEGIHFSHADIRLNEDLADLPAADVIIDAAADPSVLAGINSSTLKLVNGNLTGTINLLERAALHGSRFIFLSTSRIYPYDRISEIPLHEKNTRFEVDEKLVFGGVTSQGISEQFPLDGIRSFYGAAKLSSELFINEYAALKGLQATILRCGVIAGPGQFGKVDQGVLVFWLAMHYWKRKLAYFGYGGQGKQVRDILHIQDLMTLVSQILNNFDNFKSGTFNAGGGYSNSVSLAELTLLCQEITGHRLTIDSVVGNRVADIPYYITDNSKIIEASGWKPEKNLNDLMVDTFQWFKKNENVLKRILL